MLENSNGKQVLAGTTKGLEFPPESPPEPVVNTEQSEPLLFCNYCGKEISHDVGFCSFCGQKTGTSPSNKTEPKKTEPHDTFSVPLTFMQKVFRSLTKHRSVLKKGGKTERIIASILGVGICGLLVFLIIIEMNDPTPRYSSGSQQEKSVSQADKWIADFVQRLTQRVRMSVYSKIRIEYSQHRLFNDISFNYDDPRIVFNDDISYIELDNASPTSKRLLIKGTVSIEKYTRWKHLQNNSIHCYCYVLCRRRQFYR